MDEMIAQVDPVSGAVVGAVSKAKAHREGIWHATVHVWILDDQGRLLFQHRSPDKEHYPGLWDISAAGHIRVGEDGAREVAEELGADVALGDMTFVGLATIDASIPGGRNRERPRVYLWRSARALDTFVFTDGEVTDLAAVALSDLDALLSGVTVPVTVFDGEVLRRASLVSGDLVPLPADYWTLVRSHLD
jgi:isopentenyldiphosphate isomerase